MVKNTTKKSNNVLVKTVIIKGIPIKIIKISGKWYYKHHYCLCSCGERIRFKESHIKTGIPMFIYGHQNRGKNNPFLGKHHSQESIKKIKKARKTYLQEHPEVTSGKNNGMYGKIPWNFGKTMSEEQNEKNRKAQIGLQAGENNGMFGYEWSEEQKDRMSKALKKTFKENPKIAEHISKAQKKHWQNLSPEKKVKIMKRVRKCQKYVSNSELIVRKELDKLKIIYYPNVHEIIGTPDDIIPTEDGHPIALFIDGCYWHGCKCIDWTKVEYYLFERMIEQKVYDRVINEKLTKQGYRVVRIWEHDVKNENYKKILNKVIYNGTR